MIYMCLDSFLAIQAGSTCWDFSGLRTVLSLLQLSESFLPCPGCLFGFVLSWGYLLDHVPWSKIKKLYYILLCLTKLTTSCDTFGCKVCCNSILNGSCALTAMLLQSEMTAAGHAGTGNFSNQSFQAQSKSCFDTRIRDRLSRL